MVNLKTIRQVYVVDSKIILAGNEVTELKMKSKIDEFKGKNEVLQINSMKMKEDKAMNTDVMHARLRIHQTDDAETTILFKVSDKYDIIVLHPLISNLHAIRLIQNRILMTLVSPESLKHLNHSKLVSLHRNGNEIEVVGHRDLEHVLQALAGKEEGPVSNFEMGSV